MDMKIYTINEVNISVRKFNWNILIETMKVDREIFTLQFLSPVYVYKWLEILQIKQYILWNKCG